MSELDSITVHDQYAAEYDDQVATYRSYGAEFLFGLSYEYVRAGDSLLDLGIGTGLGSRLFARAGLAVSGVDGSAAMLEGCRAKGFAVNLRLFDLRRTPWPYEDGSFDHAVACGLFHFFGDLQPFFGEVGRLIRPGGLFAFTVMVQGGNVLQGGAAQPGDGYIEITRSGVPVFVHAPMTVRSLLAASGFDLLKEGQYIVPSGQPDQEDRFGVYVARKADS
jgi:predicted TPR repeat methyltransferase